MSLTNLLNKSEPFQQIFRDGIPRSKDFYTLSGKKPFSNEYKILAPYNLSVRQKAATSGTAFDYLARLTIARYIDDKDAKKESYSNLVAEKGIKILASTSKINFQKRYDSAIQNFIAYVNGEENIETIFKNVIFMAKLEQTFRSKMLPASGSKSILVADEELVIDLKNMYDIFFINFIRNSIVKPKSKVIFNPKFGFFSYLCDGADGDIIIDGILYDFKTSSKYGYDWKQIAQLLAYFYLNELNNENPYKESCMFHQYNLPIKNIALYKARYGEFEFLKPNAISEATKEAINKKLLWFFLNKSLDTTFLYETMKPIAFISKN